MTNFAFGIVGGVIFAVIRTSRLAVMRSLRVQDIGATDFAARKVTSWTNVLSMADGQARVTELRFWAVGGAALCPVLVIDSTWDVGAAKGD